MKVKTTLFIGSLLRYCTNISGPNEKLEIVPKFPLTKYDYNFNFNSLHSKGLQVCYMLNLTFSFVYRMKRRSLAGNVAVGVFALAFVSIFVAFFSASWLVSDERITGAKLQRLGLWTHCFRSLPDPQDEYQRRFFVGCRWIFDPFTKGYDQIRGYLMPCKYMFVLS